MLVLCACNAPQDNDDLLQHPSYASSGGMALDMTNIAETLTQVCVCVRACVFGGRGAGHQDDRHLFVMLWMFRSFVIGVGGVAAVRHS